MLVMFIVAKLKRIDPTILVWIWKVCHILEMQMQVDQREHVYRPYNTNTHTQ